MENKGLHQARELIRNVIDSSPKVNITLKDGSRLNAVRLYTNDHLYDSVIENKDRLTSLLNGEMRYSHIYFGSEMLQGAICSLSQIEKWELCEE